MKAIANGCTSPPTTVSTLKSWRAVWTIGAGGVWARGTASAPRMTQQEKMKTCNVGASDKKLKGDDRKTYMKSCLSTPAV